MGLSPQARGKRFYSVSNKIYVGPIPAGTGETRPGRSLRCRSGAYPRRHGGNLVNGLIKIGGWGLSPQARGKLKIQAVEIPPSGPIPAGTGETYSVNCTLSCIKAYPRRHGGNTAKQSRPNG